MTNTFNAEALSLDLANDCILDEDFDWIDDNFPVYERKPRAYDAFVDVAHPCLWD